MTRKQKSDPPPPVHVQISAGGHMVIIEAPSALDAVAAKALHLWQSTNGPNARDSGDGQISLGFSVSEPVTSPLMSPEAELPHRLTDDQETPDDRRN